MDDSRDESCVICRTASQEEIYFPIELDDYEKLATQLYDNKKLDITDTDYIILKKQD